jgi:hypothetical protein
MNKPQHSKIPGVIWPAFESQFKCQETTGPFIQNYEYKITAFGTDWRNGERKEVWWIQEIKDDEAKEFTVIKTTVNALFDRRILINKIEDND